MPTGPVFAAAELLVASRPPYSLLDAPGVAWTPDDPHWLNGVATDPDKCSIPLDFDDASDGDWPFWWVCPRGTGQSAVDALASETNGRKLVAGGRPDVVGDVFTVWVGDTCTTSSSPAVQVLVERRLRRMLDVATRIAVEREFWTGQVASRAGFQTGWLAQPAPNMATVLNGGARTGFVTALGELEQALADRGNLVRSYIHAQPRVVTAWMSRGLVEPSPDGTYLRTRLGTVVVAGVGYTGGAPGDEASTGSMAGSWAYGTGPVRVAVSEASAVLWGPETVDRTLNDRVVRMERDVAIVFSGCPKVAVHVNPCDEYCGTGS